MKPSSLLIPAFLMTFAFSAFAQDQPNQHPSAQKLVGAWQEQSLASGNVMAFEADNVYRMYPKCGAEAADFKAKGVTSLDGKWAVDKDGALTITVVVKGETRDALVPVTFDGDVLVMPGDDKRPATRFARYKAALPPVCK